MEPSLAQNSSMVSNACPRLPREPLSLQFSTHIDDKGIPRSGAQ